VVLVDFGIASELTQEATPASLPEALEGTLAYISPEQTGRTARAVDARTDLYSLGVTLFEMLTGQRPFQERDPLALVYAHLARPIPAITALRPEVPEVLAAILTRLLAKEPEQRYQTARGVGWDLEQALAQWRAAGQIHGFTLGTQDHSPRLRLPQLLIGRDRELREVTAAYSRAAQGAVELLLVGGPSGIGKTALVRTVYLDIARTGRGVLVAGKHDQLARSTPYAALAQAFGGLLRQWLASPPAVLQRWQERIRSEVGDNARLIADAVPELDLVMGALPAVPAVPGEQILNRLKLTWLNFVRAVTAPSAPLVMFLDDLQWADSATLVILQTLLTDVERSSLLLIAAYRDSEVTPEHPLGKLSETVAHSGARVTRLAVGPLDAEQVQLWLARTLAREPIEVAPLAQVLWRKTRGNPFFLEQLLLSLHRQRQVVRDIASGRWDFDLAAIERAEVTDNVVTLLTAKVQELPEATQQILGLAACAGHQFPLRELERLSGWSRGQVSAALWPALHEELVVPVDGAYRPAQALLGVGSEGLDAEYRFLHDRVQQASYERISAEQRVGAHLEIGRRLLSQYRAGGGTTQQLLTLVRHLNLGAEQLPAGDERGELARLNLEAARRAKAASSHVLMASLVEAAQALLGPAVWREAPALAVELALERLEAAYLLREFDDVELRVQALLDLPLPALPRLAAQEVGVRSCVAAGAFARGVELGLRALAEVGWQYPATEAACGARLASEAVELDEWFAGNPAALDHLPADPAPEHLILDALQMQMIICAGFGNRPLLMGLSTVRALAELRRRGALTQVAPLLICSCTSLWSLLTGMYRRAAAWVAPAARALERTSPAFLSECLYYQGTIHFYFRPAPEAAPFYEQAFQVALKSGSFQGMSWALAAHLNYCLAWRGQSLAAVHAFWKQHWPLIRRTGDAIGRYGFELVASYHETLTTAGGGQRFLCDDQLSRGSRTLAAEGAGIAAEGARIFEAHLFLALGAYERALSRAGEAEQFRPLLLANVPVTDIPLWRGLAAARCLRPAMTGEQQGELRELLAHALARFRYFAQGCAENFQHKLHLLEAEQARLHGQTDAAMAQYEQAISLARQHGFFQIEALAAQLCGEFHLDAGRERLGLLYLGEAREAYLRWGASSLVAFLEQKYPPLLPTPRAAALTQEARTTTTSTTRITDSGTSASLDLNTTVRAAQALAGELNAERVVAQLMHLVMENAGAQRAALLLGGPDSLCVVALLSGEQVRSGLAEPLAADHPVAGAVVQYVVRTRESVVLSNAAADSRFAQDPHLGAGAARSVLAIPLVHQGRLDGVLYLEHEAAHAFPATRVALLGVLAAQSAISLQNARLYADLQAANAGLEAKVTERTDALHKALRELWAEMDLARKIQCVLLPPAQTFAGRYEFAGQMKPADEVGGDYYDALEAGGKLWVLIGDVSGHGVSAGLIMMMVQTAVRALVHSFADVAATADSKTPLTPAMLLTLVNRALWSNLQLIGKDQYMTMAALCIGDGKVVYAGLHQSVLLFRRASQAVQELQSQGSWLGIMEEIAGLNTDDSVEFGPGDCLLLYTDGLTESRRRTDRALLELEPVAEVFAQACRQQVSSQELTQRVLQLTTDRLVSDDVSVVALRHLDA
jgi:predicted ATPase/serine phosphatase RsbU (regulator of sigma subunit)